MAIPAYKIKKIQDVVQTYYPGVYLREVGPKGDGGFENVSFTAGLVKSTFLTHVMYVHSSFVITALSEDNLHVTFY